MDKDEVARLIAEIEERGRRDAEAAYEPHADDGFQISRAILQVLGRRLGLGFVLEVQAEVLSNAERWSEDEDPHMRADAAEIAAVANAGYFEDLIDELAEKLPAGRA
ncbi:hypothetical protein [Sphingomonas faeni]|uniref:hypothetical protein n=1 Tax=Sphingomonas faeni TaxID=185950 RepID=UPI00335DA678